MSIGPPPSSPPPSAPAEAQRPELPIEEPAEQEVAARLASTRVGIWLTLIVTLGGGLYALASLDRPNRGILALVFVAAVASAVVVDRLPTERIVRGRFSEHFFVGWSLSYIALIAAMAAADGGAHSPFTLLFVLPLLFGALSYPPAVTAVVGAIDVAAFVAVAATAGGGATYSAFCAFGLFSAALLCVWEASNQTRRRDALTRTTLALQDSESTSRLQARQQEEVARFGQLALGGASDEDLLAESVRIIQRVLSVDAAAVLQPLAGSEELVIRAAAGLPPEAVGVETVPAGTGSQAGYTLTAGKPVVVSDWHEEGRFGQAPVLAELGVRSGVTVMIRGSGTFGVLGAQSRHSQRFGPSEVSFMQAIANVLANAIERQEAEETVRHAAMHDPLTGLANRSLFLDRLEHALAKARRQEGSVAVLYLDLDQFKLVNDSLGHAAGDELLAEVAPRIQHVLRPADTVARFGGDEFAVLVEDVSHERIPIMVATRIAEALAQPFVLRGREQFVSASIGISIGAGTESAETLLRDADAALYRAKENGRGGYEIFDSLMRSRVVEHMRIENDLRGALERRQLELRYQPVVRLADGSIASFEALLRWRHPDWGLVGPDAFISVAEETRLIVPVGRWVIESACREAARWQALQPDRRPTGVAVNLSARQLADPELPRALERAILDTGIDPRSLSLELTESVLLEDSDDPDRVLRGLKDLGVRIVLDDFGTGFSSLGYLKRLPLDVIKLDRSFVENLSPGSTEAEIVRAVASMAAALGLEVVAEGIETVEQLRIVRALGCEHVQGYHFSKPVEPREVDALLLDPPWARNGYSSSAAASSVAPKSVPGIGETPGDVAPAST
jgi:diguanylate cyclase (GGDEF)-like protein